MGQCSPKPVGSTRRTTRSGVFCLDNSKYLDDLHAQAGLGQVLSYIGAGRCGRLADLGSNLELEVQRRASELILTL